MLAGDIQGGKEKRFFVIKNKSHKKSEDDKKINKMFISSKRNTFSAPRRP